MQYCEQALSVDRYNANALVNRGNIFFVVGDLEKAGQYYKEALSNEVSIGYCFEETIQFLKRMHLC